MILTDRISLAKLFGFTRFNLCLLLLFTALALLLMGWLPRELLQALSYAAGFLGTALAFLIGFRNNAAYQRWWEGQQIWSRLKYDSRAFALAVHSLITPGDDDAQATLVRRQIAFAWRLNRYLRKLPPGDEVAQYLDAGEVSRIEAVQTPPLAILGLQNADLKHLFAAGRLDSHRLVRLTGFLEAFNAVLGSCERLKKTPFPMQYTWFMGYALRVFLFILPLSLAGHLGYWSALFALAIGYVFIMLEYVGRHIEHPFENGLNDVPMDYVSRSIEIDLLQLEGATEVPPPVEPIGRGYLF